MTLFEELTEDREEDKEIVKSFITKDSLSPDIFKGDGESFIMHDDVRKILLKVCDSFIDSLGVEFFVHDVILTGSLSNYNWSRYSDLDLHIIVDMDEFGEESKNEILIRQIFKEFFDTKKDSWNKKHNIKIKNYDVELYVQDVNEKHVSTGIYSVLHNKWVIEPKKDKSNIEDDKIIEKGEEITKKINSLIKDKKDKDILEKIDCLRDRIKKFRKCGLDKGGEFSYENLVFKLLRRNGTIERLLKFRTSLIDKKLSLKETPK